jgi:hypothetical protein
MDGFSARFNLKFGQQWFSEIITKFADSTYDEQTKRPDKCLVLCLYNQVKKN